MKLLSESPGNLEAKGGGTFFPSDSDLCPNSFFQSLFDQIELCENLVSKVVGSAGFPWGGRHPGRVLGKNPGLLLSSRRCWLLSRLETSGPPERGSSQSRTPLLGLEGESPRWRSKIAVGTRFRPGKKGQWETRRNEVEISPWVPGHLLSALPLDNLLGGWAEPAGEETLPVGALGYSCQAPPSRGLIPFSSLYPDSGF